MNLKSNAASGVQPKTDEEYMREADRLITEIRSMLDESERSMKRARRIGSENRRTLEDLEHKLLCGKS